MNFRKYQHICRLGTQETDGILNGKCYIFPKIDGTNSSVWLDENGKVCAGSRNRTLSIGKDDNQGFYGDILANKNIANYLAKHPNHRLFGEWLVPHSLKTYKDEAWRKFYVFDVCEDDDDELKYIPYDEYSVLLNEFDITYLKPLLIKQDITKQDIANCVNNNTFAIQEGKGCGEGIVIKRYDYKNRYGRIVWAKVLHDEYINRGSKSKGQLSSIQSKEVELLIVDEFVTSNLIEKEYAKIINDNEEIERKKLIPMLLSKVWNELINEEMWNIVKKYRNPTINFKVLNNLVINKIKEVKADLFVRQEG